MSEPSAANLMNLIHHKHQVLVQLRDVGVRQMDLVERGDVSALLKLLSAKQHLIAAVQEVERKLAPFHTQDPEQRRWPTPEARASCAEKAAACQALLDEIVRAEEISESKMQRRRNEVAARLREVHSVMEARGAYQAHRRPRGQDSRAAAAQQGPGDSTFGGTAGGVDLISES